MTDSPNNFTDLVASLGHEMRSPMNGVLGFAQLLREDGQRNETEMKYLDQILFNAELQVRRVTNLIDLAQIEKGSLHMKSDPTPLSDVLRFATETILDEAASRTVSVSIDAPEATTVADVDRMRLLQVLVDIMNNAVRFARSGSTIKGHSTRRDDGVVVIDINNETDDPGYLESRMTWQTALARSAQEDENVGLGLPHAAALLENMGGSLQLRYKQDRLYAEILVPAAA